MYERPSITAVDHPPSGSGLERIGNGIALIHEGIPFDDELKQHIYGNEIPSNGNLTLDYVDLATDELARDPNNEEEILDLYQKMVKEQVPKSMPDERSEEEKKADFVAFQKRLRKYQLESGEDSTFLVKGRQLFDLQLNIRRLMYPGSREEDFFYHTIRKVPEKPFLVIQGHGGDRENNPTKWQIGERGTGVYTDLTAVLTRMNVQDDKYSAILLVSCNPQAIEPEKLGNTPIFYTEVLSGVAERNKRPKVL